MLAEVLPLWVNDFGQELGKAWPFFVVIGLIIAAVRRWFPKMLREEVTKIAGVMTETRQVDEASIEVAVAEVQKEFASDGNGSLRSSVDRIEAMLKDLARTTNKAQARILALQANQDLPLYEMDANGKLTHINAAFANLYGRPYNELIEGGWVKHISPQDLARINESGIAATENRAPWFERFTIIRADGVRLEVIGRGYPITCVDGEFFGFAGSITPAELDPIGEAIITAAD